MMTTHSPGCGVREVGSRGKSVFVEESAESVSALDDGRRRVQDPQFAGRGIGRLQVEGAVRVGCRNAVG